jgi:hypothetical protein
VAEALTRTLDELGTLHDLYPELREVIVEGRDDARLLRLFFASIEADVAVYAVDDRVSVPAPLVNAIPHDVNSRGRVVAVAIQAERRPIVGLICVIDADFDLVTENVWPATLVLTDGAAFENYALRERSFGRFLALHTNWAGTTDEAIQRLYPALQQLFLLRMELKSRSVRLVAHFVRCVTTTSSPIANVRELCVRSGLPAHEADLVVTTVEGLREAHAEHHGLAHGHDIAHAVKHLLPLRRPNLAAEIIEDLLRSSLEMHELATEPMFERLQTFAAA